MMLNSPASTPIRVLVIGAGPMAVFAHFPALARLRDKRDVVLSVVCDLDHERAAVARRKFGFLAQSGDATSEIRRPDIDAVYIFGSAQLHYEYGLMALENGKHLFVEKPIAPSYVHAAELAQTARARGLIAVGGLNRRFFKSLAAARERAGRAGWRYAEAVFHKDELRRVPSFGAATFLTANGIHALDALVFMMGSLPETLMALSGEPGDSVKSAFSAIMQWRDGAQGVFLCNNNAGSRREEYVFQGPGETVSIDAAGLTVERHGTVEKTPFEAIGDGFAAEHKAFLQAIRGTADPIHSIASIAPSLYLAELIESGYSGRVRLPQPGSAKEIIRGVSRKSIVVSPSVELQLGLAQLLPSYQLLTVADVLLSDGPRIDVVAAILGRGSQALSEDVLDKLPQLTVVGIMALSLARFAPETLLERGITVVNASSAYADSVAEFALGLAILARRRAFSSDVVMRSGGWGTDLASTGYRGLVRRIGKRARPVLARFGLDRLPFQVWQRATGAHAMNRGVIGAPRDLRGAVAGLLGWGENARVFASHLLRAGARIVVFSEHASPEDIIEAGAAPVSLAEALASDIVSLHRGLTPGTRHFLGAPELARLRPGTVLINTARGALIEPTSLLARLRQGDIFACLDTFDEEPLTAPHPLRELQNVFLTSHIAGGSKDMHSASAEEVILKVISHLNGQSVDSISADRLKTMT
jgi:phosphoglycerate dehydrogenase-like enzyme/predicted dehydrogenase